MKRFFSVLLCLTLCFILPFAVFARANETVCKTAAEVMDYVIVSKDYTTPLRIVPAVLTVNGKSRNASHRWAIPPQKCRCAKV